MLAATSLLLILATSGQGTASAGDASDPCSTYRVALQSARTALAEGRRDAALAALRQAKTLLTQCRREEARNTTLVAATRTARRAV